MELTDWTIQHIKARDAIRKTLVEHKVQGEVISCTHKHKKHHYLIAPKLVVPKQHKEFYTVVCLQTKENVDFLVEHWKDFQINNLTLLFVNPDAPGSWSINPVVHELVADPTTLREGITSLAEEVPFVE